MSTLVKLGMSNFAKKNHKTALRLVKNSTFLTVYDDPERVGQ
jgi:hypothetical protein